MKEVITLENIISHEVSENTSLSSAMQKTFEQLKKVVYSQFDEQLQKTDEDYYNSKKWKEEGFNCFGKKEKTIFLLGGYFKIERYYYYNRKRKKGLFWLDEHFEIEKYKRVADEVKEYVYNNFGEMSVTKIAKDLGLSRQTIYNILGELGKKELEEELEVSELKTLYIQADEDHIKTQKNLTCVKSAQVRIITLYEGREKVNNGRYKLLNKRQFVYSSKTSAVKIWKEVEDYILLKYPDVEIIYFGADAGKWIQRGLKVMSELSDRVNYIYDKFHLMQNMRRIFTSKHEDFARACSYLKIGDAYSFAELYFNHIETYGRNKKYVQKAFDTIINNWGAVQNNYLLEEYHGTSAEGQVSHYLSKFFSSRPKAFSHNRLKNYVKLMEYKLNGISYQEYKTTAQRTNKGRFMIRYEDERIYLKELNNVSVFYQLNHSTNTTVRKFLNQISFKVFF